MFSAKLNGLKFWFLAGAVLLAGCTDPAAPPDTGNDPITTETGQIVTIHSPLANGLYNQDDPQLSFTALEGDKVGEDIVDPVDISTDRLHAAVSDFVNGQREHRQEVPEVISGINLPEVDDGLHELEFRVDIPSGEFTAVLYYSTDITAPIIYINVPEDEIDELGRWVINDPMVVLDHVQLDSCFSEGTCSATVDIDGPGDVHFTTSETNPDCPSLCIPPLDDGVYTIHISFPDAAGNQGLIVFNGTPGLTEFTIVLDATPPDVEVVQPPPPPVPPPGEQPTVTISETPEGEVTFTSDASGTATVTIDNAAYDYGQVTAGEVYAVDLSGTNDGVHFVNVVVVDDQTQTEGAATTTVYKDSTSPNVVTLVGNIQNGGAINVSSGALTFTSNEDGRAVVTLDPASGSPTVLAQFDPMVAGQSYDVVVNGLALGDHQIKFTLFDNHGNEGAKEINFGVVDKGKPMVTIISPTPEELLNTGGGSLTLEFDASDDFTAPGNLTASWVVGLTTVTWSNDTGDWVFEDAGVVGYVCCMLPVTQDGIYDVTLTVSDDSSNANATVVHTRFRVDIQPPVVNITNPVHSAEPISNNKPVLRVATEPCDYCLTVYLVPGTEPGSDALPDNYADFWREDLAVGGALTQPGGGALVDGTYTVVVENTDKAGNTGVGWATFTVEATPPKLDILDPVKDAVFTNPESDLKIRYRVNDARFVNAMLQTMVNGQVQSSVPVLSEDISPEDRTYTTHIPMPGDGTYRLWFQAGDPVRPEPPWTTTVDFTVNSFGVEITFPDEDNRVFRSDAVVPLTFNYNEAYTITVLFDGVDQGAIDPANQPINLDLQNLVNPGDLDGGSHTIKVVGKNDSGMVSDSVEILVDDTPTWIEIKSPKEGHEYNWEYVALHYHLHEADWVESETVFLDGQPVEGLTHGDHGHYNTNGHNHAGEHHHSHFRRWHHHANHNFKIFEVPPGDHTLRVEAYNKDHDKIAEASVSFSVKDRTHHGNSRWGRSSCRHGSGGGGNPWDPGHCD